MLKTRIFQRTSIVSIVAIIILISTPYTLTALEIPKHKITFTDKVFENDVFRITLDNVEVLSDGRLRFHLIYIKLSQGMRPPVSVTDWYNQRIYLIDESGNEYNCIESAVVSTQKLSNSDIEYQILVTFPGFIRSTRSLSLFSTYFSHFSHRAFFVIIKDIKLKHGKI